MSVVFNKLIDKLPNWNRLNHYLEIKALLISVFTSTLILLFILINFEFSPLLTTQYAATYSDTYNWTRSAGSTAGDYSGRAITDSSGNVYYTGAYVFTVDFDGTAGVDNHTSVSSSRDNFVSKYDSAGNYLWTRSFGGSTYDDSYDISIDSSGNVYLTGQFGSTNVDFDGTAGTDLHSSIGGTDIFITKYNSDGSYGWTRTIGSSNADSGNAIEVDQINNVVYISGTFYGTNVDFDGTAGTDLHSSVGSRDFFITKYDLNGNYLWTRTAGSTNSDDTYGLTVDTSGNVYAVGQFQDTVDFDGTAGTDNHISAGSRDAFITSYDSSGNYLYTNTWGGTDSDGARDVIINNSAASPKPIYIVGSFRSATIDFDPTAGTDNYSTLGLDDVFVTTQLDNGNYSWTRTWGGNSFDFADSVHIDSTGNPYISASISYPGYDIDYDGTAGVDLITGVGSYDAALSSYDASGGYRWTRLLGSSNIDHVKVHIDSNDDIITTGWFWNTIDFDHTAGIDNHTSAGDRDIFLSKYEINEVVPTSTPGPTNTPTPVPTNTPIPTSTPTATPGPTNTITPTSTAAPTPTFTPVPVFTATPIPTTSISATSTPAPTIPVAGTILYQIINLNSSLDVEDINSRNIEYGSEYGLSGLNDVMLLDSEENIPIARFSNVNFDHNLDWSNLTADLDQETAKAYFSLASQLDGQPSQLVLYVPKSSDATGVAFCPNANSFNTITAICTNGFSLTPGEVINGVSLESSKINGFDVWVISGLEKGGAISITESITVSPTDIETATISATPIITGLPDTGGDDDVPELLGLDLSSGSAFMNDLLNLPLNLFEAIGEAIARSNLRSTPVVVALPLTGMGVATAVSYPRLIMYGIFWIKGRKRNKPWGIVFDAKNNKPLPFASVRLYKDNQFIKEEVTNLDGKYGFTIDPGLYTLKINISNYEEVAEKLEITEEEFITKNIGLTPSDNTNIHSKQFKIINSIRANLGKINTVLVIIGLIFSIFASIVTTSLFNLVVLALYLIQFVLLFISKLFARRNWGYVYDSYAKVKIKGAFVRLFDPEEQRQLDVKMTDEEGRYNFIVSPGEYLIKVDFSGYKFPSSLQKNIFTSKTSEQFINLTVEKGKSINTIIGLDPL